MATISQRISIEGGDDIRKQLEALAKAASTAFGQIEDAASKAQIDPQTQKAVDGLAAAFGDLTQASSKTAPELEDVGKTADAAGEGFVKVGEEGAKAAEAITAVGDASKQAATDVAKTGDAAEKSGTSYANLALNVVKTGAAVGSMAAGITSAGAATAALGVQTVTAAAAVGTFALSLGSTLVAGIGAAVGALGILAAALERIAFDDARLSDTLDHLALKTRDIKQSFTDLQVGQAAFQQIGISAEKFRSIIANIAVELGKFDAGGAISKSADAITAATQKALEAEKKVLEAQIAREAAGGEQASFQARMRLIDINRELEKQNTALAQAEKAAGEAQGAADAARAERAKAQINDLRVLVDIIRQVEAGAKGVTFGDTTAEARLEAIKVRLSEVAKAGGDVGKALLNIIANLPREDAFKVGAAFGLSETDVDRVRRYGTEVTKIDDLFKKIRAAGVLISPETAGNFEKMNEASQRLESAWERLKQAWASTVFSNLAAQGTTVIDNITARVVEFAAQALESFNMFGSQLMTTLGQIASGWGTVFSQIGQGLAIIGQGIANLVTTAVGGAWQWIVDTFNSAVGWVLTKANEVKAFIDDWVVTPVGGAWEWLKSTFISACDALLVKANQTKSFIDDWVVTPVGGAFEWLKNAFLAAMASIADRMRQSFGSAGAPAAPATGGGSGLAGGGLLGGRGTGTSDSNLAWVSRGEYITPARIVRQPGVLAFLEALRRSGNLRGFAGGGLIPAFAEGGQVATTPADAVMRVMAQVREMIDSIQQTIARTNDAMFDVIRGVQNTLDKGLKAFSESIQGLMQSTKQASDTLWDFEQKLSGHASGGLLGGRGSGTSDSNLAWVSRGEFITPAHAVRQPGVLAFLEALRRSGGNLRDILDGMRGFALGGLVAPTLSIPAFAGGGMSRDLGTLTLGLPGGGTVSVQASSGVVDELRKAAAMAQVRSGGRKPSRYS